MPRLRQGCDPSEGGKLFLPPLQIRAPNPQTLRGQPRIFAAQIAHQRNGEQLLKTRAQRFVRIPHHGEVGRTPALRSKTLRLRLDRRACKLYLRTRISERRRSPLQKVLGGGSAYGRQGDRALPRHYMARSFNGARTSRSQTNLRSRVASYRRR